MGKKILQGTKPALISETYRKLKEKNIKIIEGISVAKVSPEGALLESGELIPGNLVVWATGAEPQPLCAASDLSLNNGYFEVNDYMQSTSHPNVFAGGDCVTMKTYAAEHFPPKAGVYAVRAGPIIAENVFKLS